MLLQREGARLVAPPYRPGQLGYVLGSDFLGRDYLSRLVYGARTTLGLALAINLVRFAVALPAGLWAGGRRGLPARILQVAASGFGALPALILALMAMRGVRPLLLGANAWMVAYVLMLGLTGAPRIAEQVRRRTEEVALMPHVEAARALGARPFRILVRHVLPLLRGDLLVMVPSEIAWVLMIMAQLALFGVYPGGFVVVETISGNIAVAEYLPEWGQMLGTAWLYLRQYPWLALCPGLALGLTAAGFHLLAEGLRQRDLRFR
nr:MAG: ABC transporter permease [Bacillota bacterium]